MTDAYPPFRLDQGGSEPGAPAPDEAAPAPLATGTGSGGGWSGGRIALLAVGAVTGLIALGVLAGGAAALAIDKTQREDGFVTSPSHTFVTPTYGLVSETADLDGPGWAWNDLVGTVRIRSRSDRPVFVGIGPEADVQRYLAGVSHEIVGDLRDDPGDYDRKPGGAPATPPGEQTFWATSATGSGEIALDWDLKNGRWAVVAMNADGSRAVDTTLDVGAELDATALVRRSAARCGRSPRSDRSRPDRPLAAATRSVIGRALRRRARRPRRRGRARRSTGSPSRAGGS